MPKARINGIELYYELHGQGDETLVFANGVLGNTTSWLNQTMLFAPKYRVLLYDYRNQGRSDKPTQDSTFEIHAQDLTALLESLGIASAHLVGISYGGEIGMTMALLNPERIKSLVISNAVSQVDLELEIKIEAWLTAVRSNDARRFFRVSSPDIFCERFRIAHPSLMKTIEEEYTKLDLADVARLIARFREFNITNTLVKITAPTLVIASAQDTLKPSKYSALIHQKIEHSELFVIEDAGHALTYEKPQEFNTLVMGFLEKQRRNR
jgi:pimeloyl-ACP methyl ester carboxylesterase